MIHQPNGGKIINPFTFHKDDISLEQLAHALACQNRYYGHVQFPISIAQHAVSVSKLVEHYSMQGLHHDDSEALLGDINKWLKDTPAFHDYRNLENVIQLEFYKKFNCPLETTEEVMDADRLAVRCEMAIGFNRYYKPLHPKYGPPTAFEMEYFLDITDFKEITWREARDLFLERHSKLEVANGLHNP